MRDFKGEHQGRATAILKAVEGLSIAEANWLLKWCEDFLLEQKVDFTKSAALDRKSPLVAS